MKRIAFVHPDLGIGGAERLVVDAACALQKQPDFEVTIFTAHHDREHCFPETIDGMFNVEVRGDWLPRSICGKFVVLCASFRCIYVSFCLLFHHFDFVFVDQVSSCIPVLLLKSWSILFYCHFPDMKLSPRKTCLKRIYRLPIDFVEQITTGMADRVVVNSYFTQQVYKQSFSLLCTLPDVLYPTVKLSQRNSVKKIKMKKPTFVSINRFERKKNVVLAIDSLNYVLGKRKLKCQLIVAGGYDHQHPENLEHFKELRTRAESLGLKTTLFPNRNGDVVFFQNFTDEQKEGLFKCARAVLYTPPNEHFGIVPVEAMHAGVPVIALESGGPKETVEHEGTGILCENSVEAFGAAMARFLEDPNLSARLGRKGRSRVDDMFSNEKFSKHLVEIVRSMLLIGTDRTLLKIFVVVPILSFVFVFICVEY